MLHNNTKPRGAKGYEICTWRHKRLENTAALPSSGAFKTETLAAQCSETLTSYFRSLHRQRVKTAFLLPVINIYEFAAFSR